MLGANVATERDEGERGKAVLPDATVAELRRKLARAVTAVCPPWLAPSADDIVQDAMLKVLAIGGRGEGNAALPASYLRKVAWTVTVDEIRRRQTQREESVDAIESHAASTDRGTESAAVHGELAVGLRACLERIVDDRRRAVALHLAGWSIREVADGMQWPVKRAENLIYRGLADLRACLEKKGIVP